MTMVTQLKQILIKLPEGRAPCDALGIATDNENDNDNDNDNDNNDVDWDAVKEDNYSR